MVTQFGMKSRTNVSASVTRETSMSDETSFSMGTYLVVSGLMGQSFLIHENISRSEKEATDGKAMSVGTVGSCDQVDKIRVLYATDGYTVVYSLHLLVESAFLKELYVISHDYLRISTSTSKRLHVTFCLLSHMSDDILRVRSRPMFTCDFIGETASDFLVRLREGVPIATEFIIANLNIDATFRYHRETILALSLACRIRNEENTENLSVGRKELALLLTRFENKVISAYRRIYDATFVTPFWFVSKFGPTERGLVSIMRYYLLEAKPDDKIAGTFDLQGLKDLSCTFVPHDVNGNPSKIIVSQITTFGQLSEYCCKSDYMRTDVHRAFLNHLRTRILADTTYINALDETVGKYRAVLRIPAKEFVKYVYSAHLSGYKRAAILHHLTHLTQASLRQEQTDKIHDFIQVPFFPKLRDLCNMSTFVDKYVQIEKQEIPLNISKEFIKRRSYVPQNNTRMLGICLTSTELIKRLDRLNEDFEKRGLSYMELLYNDYSGAISITNALEFSRKRSSRENVLYLDATQSQNKHRGPLSRLLSIANSDVETNNRSLLSLLYGVNIPISVSPVYRVAMPDDRQAFAVVTEDTWSTNVTADYTRCISEIRYTLPEQFDHNNSVLFDLYWTRHITSSCWSTKLIAGVDPSIQMYLNRNEIFNDKCAIFTVMLDLDFSLRKQSEFLLMSTLHRSMRHARDAILETVTLLFKNVRIDASTYPIYFYKTACPSNTREMRWDQYSDSQTWNYEYDWPPECEIWDEESLGNTNEGNQNLYKCPSSDLALTLRCTCAEKLGFRIAIPIPAPYAFVGKDTIKVFSKLVQQAMQMHEEFIEVLHPHLADYTFVDTGIYAPNRSLRLPFFGKVSKSNVYGRLLPFIVFPSGCNDDEKRSVFALAHADPRNFHYHSVRPDNLHPQIIITDIKELLDDKLFGATCNLSKQIAKGGSILRDSDPIGCKSIPILESLARLNKYIYIFDDLRHDLDSKTLKLIIEDIAVPAIQRYISDNFTHYAHEYSHLIVSDINYTPEKIRFSIAQAGKTRSRFSCLKYAHRGAAAQTVLAYIVLFSNTQGLPCVALQTKCFATKCGANLIQTQFAIQLTDEIVDEL
ncbi:helicase-primase primase subunit [Psittacid alphaherpesvirus 5]|nr:helicase-primase primase subunit [Psittacid alphaherpesvirus 5]